MTFFPPTNDGELLEGSRALVSWLPAIVLGGLTARVLVDIAPVIVAQIIGSIVIVAVLEIAIRRFSSYQLPVMSAIFIVIVHDLIWLAFFALIDGYLGAPEVELAWGLGLVVVSYVAVLLPVILIRRCSLPEKAAGQDPPQLESDK